MYTQSGASGKYDCDSFERLFAPLGACKADVPFSPAKKQIEASIGMLSEQGRIHEG